LFPNPPNISLLNFQKEKITNKQKTNKQQVTVSHPGTYYVVVFDKHWFKGQEAVHTDYRLHFGTKDTISTAKDLVARDAALKVLSYGRTLSLECEDPGLESEATHSDDGLPILTECDCPCCKKVEPCVPCEQNVVNVEFGL